MNLKLNGYLLGAQQQNRVCGWWAGGPTPPTCVEVYLGLCCVIVPSVLIT